MWLRADAGLDADPARGIVTWLDQSTEQNDFSQPAAEKRPVWEVSRGRTITRFLSPEVFLANTTLAGPMEEFTVVVVLAAHELGGACQYLSAGDLGQFVFVREGGGPVTVGTSPATLFTTPPLMKKYERQRYVFINRGPTASLSLNGREIANRPSVPSAPWSGFRLGGTNANNSLRGDIAELLIYKRVLSPQELARIDAYLTAKYWDLPGCVSPAGRGPHPERPPRTAP